ncbi:arginyl-tRNA synthetase [Ruminococcaceae bacterium KH2T8]|nr:arginyl-tRNA synthetase [Ruminococcaceae bacterium KH2T8]
MDYKSEIAAKLAEITGLETEQVYKLIEIPPQVEMGDYAFPCFTLAKTLRKAPPMIATDIAGDERLASLGAMTAKNVGPYVNFYIDRGFYAVNTVGGVLKDKDSYGKADEGQGKMVIIEYSSPNIAKPFHVGHAFTTIIGNSLSKIYTKLGYDVVRMNHLGDYGTQFGKLITAYRLWGDDEALNKDAITELLRIYVKFHEEEKNDPSLTDTARENFKRLEDGCEEEVALWKKFRDMSLVVFEKLYKRLGVEFDNYNGESYYAKMADDVANMLKEKGLLVESEGAQVVDLEEYGVPPCIILKSDGTTIYATRDIAAIMYRHEKYNFDKNIYVVGTPQALHFKQVFSVMKKAGYDYADNCVHVGFGLVKFKNMKFSTRDGNIVLLEDLLNEAVAKTREVIAENSKARGQDMTEAEIDEIAEKVGIGAVIYTYVKSGRERDIVFSWEEMLDFEGDTAPYLMYTYARTKSILRKAKEQGFEPSSDEEILKLLSSDEEYSVVRSIADFPDSIKKAAASNEPFMISRQIALVARNFNRFYNNSSILNADTEDQKKARLALCEAVCDTLKSGLELLGIGVVERM